MSNLFVHANTVTESVSLKRHDLLTTKRDTLATMTADKAEDLAFELLSASYLIREKTKTRMKPDLKAEFTELLEYIREP